MHILVFLPLFWESRLWNLNCYWSKHPLSPVPAGCEETYSPLTYWFHLFSHQVCDSSQPHGAQYARSPCPWPSPKLPAVFSFHPVWSHGFLYEKIWPTLSATPGICKFHGWLWHKGEVSILTKKVLDILWNHLCCVWPYWLAVATIMPHNKPAHVSEA